MPTARLYLGGRRSSIAAVLTAAVPLGSAHFGYSGPDSCPFFLPFALILSAPGLPSQTPAPVSGPQRPLDPGSLQPNGCSGHPAGSSSGRSTVQPSTARGATRTRPMTHAARRRCGARDAPQQGRRAGLTLMWPGIRGYEGPASLRTVKLPLRRFRGPRCCFVLRGRGTAGRAPAASRTRQCSRPRPSRRPSRRDRSRRRRRWRSARPPLPRLARHRLARRPHRSAAPQRRAAAPRRSADSQRRNAAPPCVARGLSPTERCHFAAPWRRAGALVRGLHARARLSLARTARAVSPDVSSDGSGGRCARRGLAPRWHRLIRGDPPVIHRRSTRIHRRSTLIHRRSSTLPVIHRRSSTLPVIHR